VTKAASRIRYGRNFRFEMASHGSALDPGPPGSQVDVLVVDDDHASRTAFRSILCDAGYNADEAEDGFVALERLRSVIVASVLLEVNLPGLDGLQLLDRLDNPPPVILMSAAAYGSDVILRRSKVHMFIQKPVPPEHLLAAVSRTLKADRQRRGQTMDEAVFRVQAPSERV
jgi:DNA-binding response OmpR family regulator